MFQEEVEFPCPACGSVNRIAERLIPVTGEMRCGTCGETVSLRPAQPLAPKPHVTGSIPRPVANPEQGGPSTTGAHLTGGFATTGSQPAPPQPSAHQVCCPECGHRFDPAQARATETTILIVEDTDFFLQLAIDVLGKQYRTIGVRTVAEARQALATSPVDLVILDLTLPDEEGTEVLRALPRRDIPVLIYTSRDETSLLGAEWEMLTSLGACDVLHKGINIEEALMQKSNELLAHRVAASLR